MIERTQKYFVNLQELSFINLEIEAQKGIKSGLLFPKIIKLTLDHSVLNKIIFSIKTGKVAKELAAEKVYKSMIEDNKTLKYLETIIFTPPSTFRSPADEDAFINNWEAIEKCKNARHIDQIKVFIPMTKEMWMDAPKISKTFVTVNGKNQNNRNKIYLKVIAWL